MGKRIEDLICRLEDQNDAMKEYIKESIEFASHVPTGRLGVYDHHTADRIRRGRELLIEMEAA